MAVPSGSRRNDDGWVSVKKEAMVINREMWRAMEKKLADRRNLCFWCVLGHHAVEIVFCTVCSPNLWYSYQPRFQRIAEDAQNAPRRSALLLLRETHFVREG